MGDDGFGLAVLERMQERWRVPPELVDGGTWGMRLLPLLESARRVIVLDAIDTGADPGALVVLAGADLPRYFSHKLSPHQIDLREVLALATLHGALPDELVAMGAQPERLELGVTLSSVLAGRVDEIVDRAAAQLLRWGHPCSRAMEVVDV